jgi:hypothetical protein
MGLIFKKAQGDSRFNAVVVFVLCHKSTAIIAFFVTSNNLGIIQHKGYEQTVRISFKKIFFLNHFFNYIGYNNRELHLNIKKRKENVYVISFFL